MKPNYLFRYAKLVAIYVIVFFLGTIAVDAQCPTVNDPAPTVCDASSYTIADVSADDATAKCGGIVWYDQSSGGVAFNPSQLVREGTYYADDTTGSCVSRSAITVTFTVPVSGQNLDAIFCSNENP